MRRPASPWVLGLLALAAWSACPAEPVRAADVNSLMQDGRKLYEKGQYDKALRVFFRARDLDPGNLEARDYVNRCMDKIVEKETGAKVKRRVKESQTGSGTIAPEEKLPAWAIPPGTSGARSYPAPPARKPGARKPSGPEPDAPVTSKILIQQDLLRAGYARRVVGEGAIQVKRAGRQAEVVLFMNRLFLPMSDVLAPDAVREILAAVDEVRSLKTDTVILRAVDSLTPAVRHTMLDLPSRRCAVVYSAFVHASVSPGTGDPTAGLTAADLDD